MASGWFSGLQNVSLYSEVQLLRRAMLLEGEQVCFLILISFFIFSFLFFFLFKFLTSLLFFPADVQIMCVAWPSSCGLPQKPLPLLRPSSRSPGMGILGHYVSSILLKMVHSWWSFSFPGVIYPPFPRLFILL